jgi:hypothetical protein
VRAINRAIIYGSIPGFGQDDPYHKRQGFATSREDALRLLTESDVIVLTDAVTDRSHPYPMNAKIKEYWDDLWQWTNQNRSLLYTTEIFGIPYRVFVRFPGKTKATTSKGG